jgi:branched-chain amino acid transport system ATP-binding protein
VLLLDEPLEGLAPIIVDELLGALRRIIVEERMAAIIVEQSARKILPLTERAIILDRGAIAHEGPSPELAEDAVRLASLLGVAGQSGAGAAH